MNPVLVELPSEVHKIQAFREGVVTHPGWHAPVTLVLDNSFVVINSDSGLLLRTFQLPADRAKIVDCKYIASEKSFLVATDDAHLMIIPDGSKTSAEYFQQKWPVRIKELVLVGEKSVVVVSDNDVACVRIEQNRISVPNYASAKTGKKTTAANSPPFLKKAFSSCGKIVRITAQLKLGVHVYLWEDPLEESASSSVLNEDSATSFRQLEEIQIEHEEIKSIQVEPSKQCIHIIVASKTETGSKKNKDNEGSRWLKYDLAGNLLFERKLSFAPTFCCLSSDRLWLLTPNHELTSWSARYGTLLQSISVTAPISSNLCELVHLEGDQGNYSLLYGLTNRDGQATTIFRYDVGGVSTAPVSLAALVGSHSKRSRDTFLVASDATASPVSRSATVVPSTSSMYYKVLHEEMDGDKMSDYFSQDKNKRRKISQLISLTTTQIQTLLHKFSDDLVANALSGEDWVQILSLIRLGVFSIQGHRAVWQRAFVQQRLDVLSEMIRFAVDINEFQVVEVLTFSLQVEDDVLDEYTVLGGNVVYKATQEAVMQLLSEEEKRQWQQQQQSQQTADEEDTNNKKKASKKSNKKDKEKEKTAEEAVNSTDESANLMRMKVVRALVESVLYRVPRFSPTIVAEALQRVSMAAVQLILRMLVFAVFDMTTVVGSGEVHHSFPFLGSPQLLAAVEWIEAILDSHFATFLFETASSVDLKKCLQTLVQLVKHTDDAIEAVEEARGLWLDIERSLTRQGVQPRVDPGLYTVEILRL